jgi:hypothetical protein
MPPDFKHNRIARAKGIECCYNLVENSNRLPTPYGLEAHIGSFHIVSEGASQPAFVYGIIVSLFIFFNTFAVNMILQYKQAGPWRDLFGEKVYIILSLTVKALLGWQVFANVLIPSWYRCYPGTRLLIVKRR